MTPLFDGFPASPGMASGKAKLLRWEVPEVPDVTLGADKVDAEVERFHTAREWTKGRIREIQEAAAARLGPVEARIFEPQLMLLEDEELVGGTERYIRENRLTAPRAFYWRILELRNRWATGSHPMVADRLNDLEDVEIRILHRLLGLPDPDSPRIDGEDSVILVAPNLTPSLTVQLDRERISGIATDRGTRTSHWAILARSLDLPAVVGLGDLSESVADGAEMILDGRIGRVIVGPGEDERNSYRQRRSQLEEWEEELALLASEEAATADGQPVALRGNIDLPSEAETAREHGAEGVGLFRTEFLVVGRRTMPDEEEQYETYRRVTSVFPDSAVVIRTFDLGGDKFPLFLDMPAEENPFLGWRAIRVCLDRPDLFRTQLRAVLRATAQGDLRIMLPFIKDVDEIIRTRDLLEELEHDLDRQGIPYNRGYKLGILVETPAAALDAPELARHSDFFSIGTNDLVQYTLAVDRTNARLADLFNPFHPAVVRLLDRVARAGRAAGIEVSVCGEVAANPLGMFLLLGLDITAFSVAWPSLPEVKKVIRSLEITDAREAAARALKASTAREVTRCLVDGIGEALDLSVFSGRWNLDLLE